MPTVTPFLMFNDQAEAAMNFYVSAFPNAKIISTGRGGDGRVNSGTFEVEGQRFLCFNGGSYFSFSNGFSVYVNCETQDEVDALWDKLVAGGEPQRCGWLKDRFGVSWQIIPSALARRLQDKDPAKAKRVFEAMLAMVKIDIAGIERAYAG